MKRFNLKRLSTMSFVILFAIGIPFAAYTADRLVVLNDIGEQALCITDEGKIGIGSATIPAVEMDLGGGAITVNGADNTGGYSPRVAWREDGRMDFGYRGNGGGNLEAYSKGHATRGGEFRFVYGGGDFGNVFFYHYDGYSWAAMMQLDKDGVLAMAYGAYCDGSSWVDGSSREYKKDIRELTGDEAMDTLKGLSPVKFAYKSGAEKTRVGFIAEDVPELVATKDRKGMSSMDVVAVLTRVVQDQQKTIAELSKRMREIEETRN